MLCDVTVKLEVEKSSILSAYSITSSNLEKFKQILNALGSKKTMPIVAIS
jgi:hypothetical protein